jgi:hypothetical protein
VGFFTTNQPSAKQRANKNNVQGSKFPISQHASKMPKSER